MPLSSTCWLREMRFFVFGLFLLNLLWELLQLPLYTIWNTGTPREIVIAVLHCTAGDVSIGMVCLVGALVAEATAGWPNDHLAPWPCLQLGLG